MDDYPDKRNDSRNTLDLTARYRIYAEDGATEIPEFESAKIVNISTTGLGLVSGWQLMPGNVVDVEIDIKGKKAVHARPVRVSCMAKWCKKIMENIYKTGVEFIVIKQKDIGKLQNFCDRI